MDKTIEEYDPVQAGISKFHTGEVPISLGVLQWSDKTDKIAPAIVKAQGEMKGVKKDATNPHFNSSYMTLGAAWEMARPVLYANNLACMWAPSTSKEGLELETTILHSSGQWCRSMLTMPIEQRTAQKVGGAITYAKRYSGCALFAIIDGEDDDGNAASEGSAKRTPKGQAPKAGDAKTNLDLDGLL